MRPVVTELTDQGNPGVQFLHVQAQIGVALVILQKNVVFWHIALDEGAFQHQRLKFTGRNNHIKMMDFAYHHLCFWGVGGGILKILADPVFQLFGLADIDNLVGFIPHNIHPGCIRQGQCLLFQFVKCHGVTPTKKPPHAAFGIETVSKRIR